MSCHRVELPSAFIPDPTASLLTSIGLHMLGQPHSPGNLWFPPLYISDHVSFGSTESTDFQEQIFRYPKELRWEKEGRKDALSEKRPTYTTLDPVLPLCNAISRIPLLSYRIPCRHTLQYSISLKQKQRSDTKKECIVLYHFNVCGFPCQRSLDDAQRPSC